MPNVKLILEYDGSNFHGWQHQPGLRTVQGELQRVLEMVLRVRLHELIAAGRTDAGVHAVAQVVNFHMPEAPDLCLLKRSVNAIFRGEIAVTSAELASENFHATLDACGKEYQYTVVNREAPPTLERHTTWHIRAPLDLQRMQKEAALLVGTHDFKSFQGPKSTAKTTVRRVLSSGFRCDPPYLIFSIIGEGFIKQMVRNIMGTLVAFGRGRMRCSSILEIIEAHDRRAAGPTAPPQGLCLKRVFYDRAELQAALNARE